jgi:FkbM family methyltransferase
MKFINIAINLGAKLIRFLSDFIGVSKISRSYNKLILDHIAEPIVIAKMKNGTIIRVDLRSNTEFLAYYRGEYDTHLINTILSLIDPKSVFLDIGANIGFYTIALGDFFRRNSTSGKVIAFEPFEANYNRTVENIRDNNLSNWCSVKKIGLSSDSREELLVLREDFLEGAFTGNASIATDNNFDNGFVKVLIKVEKLDDIWKTYRTEGQRIDWIKIDIEGHEDFCLLGGQETIRRDRPTILMEVNKPYYQARNVEINKVFLPLIPENYVVYRKVDTQWELITNFDSCNIVDNVFLVPNEKAMLENYKYLFNCK